MFRPVISINRMRRKNYTLPNRGERDNGKVSILEAECRADLPNRSATKLARPALLAAINAVHCLLAGFLLGISINDMS